ADGWGLYRRAVMAGELVGVTPVLDALRASPDAEARARVASAAGRAVARLHAAGIAHADLNLSNILVGRDEAAVVDLDRARLRPDGLSARDRSRSLRRLARSVRKLDPSGRVIDDGVAHAFRQAYAGESGGSCAS